MIKVNYTELDGPYGPAMRLEAAGHAGYAPAGQDIVCAGVSTLMQALVSLLAGEENAHSDAFDEPDGPRLTVTAARPCTAWVEGAFELAKAGFALLAERYPDNVRFADRSARGKQEMMDLQLFADGGEAAAPALSAAQEQQAVASGTMKPGEKADARQETTAPEGEKEVKETEPVKAEEGQEQEPPRPALPKRFPGSQAVDALHRRWAAEEAMMRRAVPEFSLQKELADPEMRRLMQLPGMRMLDAYRLAHYGDAMRQTARTVEQGVVERIRQRGARPAENGTHPGSAAVTGADVNRMTRSQREAMERQAAESDIHLECPHILMWIRADAPELQRRSWLHEAEERCRALGADMWGALSEDGFLLALEADDLFALEMPLRQVMADFAAVHGVICGVSRPYGGTMGFQKADRSARAALHMAARTETPCVTDDPAGVVRLLEESSPVETDAYIHRQLGTLLRQPEPRRQELLDTLASWLRCMGNQRRMARELHLHYNTVSYRLQQLWMLLEADPVDPMKRLALETALYLYRYRRT